MKKLLFALGGLMVMGAGCVAAGPVEETEESTDKALTVEETSMYTFPGALSEEEIAGKQVRITTEKGDIVFKLFDETAPMTVSNFVYLAGEGYFDGLTFHRREEGFVIQGGDPNGNGTGGPGYTFEDELDDEYGYTRGIVAMANRGPDTNGSQFFIMLDETPLPKAYSIFGEVTEGLDIVDEIAIGDVMTKVVVEDVESNDEEVAQDEEDTEAVEDEE